MDKIPNPFKKKEEGDAPASNPVTDFAHTTQDALAKGMETTVGVAEKGVQALDPLNIFVPHDTHTRLVLKEGLFQRTGTEAYPILTARGNDSFHDLVVQAKSTPSDELVMQDAKTNKPVLVIDRTPKPRMYDIYKTCAMTDGQQPAKTSNDGDLYLRAKVVMADKDLQVFMEGQSDPMYEITKAPGLVNYSTKRVIKMKGEKNPVASMSNWEDGAFMLEISPGVDAGLMLCLAIIADDNAE